METNFQKFLFIQEVLKIFIVIKAAKETFIILIKWNGFFHLR